MQLNIKHDRPDFSNMQGSSKACLWSGSWRLLSAYSLQLNRQPGGLPVALKENKQR